MALSMISLTWNHLFGYLIIYQISIGNVDARQCTVHPVPKNQVCRCFHRPGPGLVNVSFIRTIPLLRSFYDLQAVEIDPDYVAEEFTDNSICVYFGHSAAAPEILHTDDFVVQALNEYGWPIGIVELTNFDDICVPPSGAQIRRDRLDNQKFFKDSTDPDVKCFREAKGIQEELYSVPVEGSPVGNPFMLPGLLNFFNPLKRASVGVTALVRLKNGYHPLQIKFVVEALITVEGHIENKMIRMFSESYDIIYDSDDKAAGFLPSTPDNVYLDLGYSYQITDYTKCIPTGPTPPDLPVYPEFMCACYLQPRRPSIVLIPGSGQEVEHQRILGPNQTLINWNEKLPAKPLPDEVSDFYKKSVPNDFTVEYDTAGNFLVAIYPFMPAYKEREWTQREIVMEALADNGMPLGRWINPWKEDEKDMYQEACLRVFAARGLKYLKPPYPAVGDCIPDNASIVTVPRERYSKMRACYFHFHAQYFFADCIEECEDPLYICAVWQYEDAKSSPLPSKPFDFQFVAHMIYYHNVKPAQTPNDLQGLQEPTIYTCSNSSTKGTREWYLMETHAINNKAYFRASPVWRYTAKPSRIFKMVGPSSEDADSIIHKDYQLSVVGPPPPNDTTCVEPATYFLESKDNNICKCTFWGNNLDTWQLHYGRGKSCKGPPSSPFTDLFKLELFPQRMTDDTVIVRVYTVDPGKTLREDFVLHAIYIQGLDQFGLPVGKFDKGHWKNPGVPKPGPCATDLFPADIDPVIKRHPIFGIEHCPKHPQIKELGILPGDESAELYTYKNLWRDGERYSEVCAKFHFPPSTKSNFKHVTHIQLIAFIRLEDKLKTGSRQAYMFELRSNILLANDFSNHPVTAIPIDPPPPATEKATVRVPLNYRYYQHTIKPTLFGQIRTQCVEPGKEPPRLFDLCRHYITTEPINEEENKEDVDLTMDKFFGACRQWTKLVFRYGENHPQTRQVQAKLPGLKLESDHQKLWKSCFSLKAYQHNIVNSIHVEFRVLEHTDFCKNNLSHDFIKEVAIVALNEDGYPIGRRWARDFGSFKLYNHFYSKRDYERTKKSREYCANDTIRLNLDAKVYETKMVHDNLRSKCIYEKASAYPLEKAKFHQDHETEADLPSLMIWANFGFREKGFCANWYYGTYTPSGNLTTPNAIQFIASMHVIGGTGDAKMGTRLFPGDKVITIRSPKYKFEYNKAYYPGSAPGTVDCHDKEMETIEEGKPDDDCKCDRETLKTNQSIFCTKLYGDFNHILDNNFYRACLTVEDPSRGHDDFGVEDCRTKIEYPMPPLVYKPEQIKLTVTGGGNYSVTDTIGVKDPVNEVFEACGLIKQCYSRYSNDQVDKDCIEDRSCDILVTFGKGLGEGPTNDEAIIEIYAVARGWAAIGISPEDELMGEDYVVECVKEGALVNIYNSWNILPNQGVPMKPNKTNWRLRGENGVKHNIRPVKSLFYHDKLYCKFYIKKKFTKKDSDLQMEHEYDLDKKYYHILAFADELPSQFGEQEGNIKIHLPASVSEVGRKIVVVGERLSPVPSQARLIRLHGVFMVFSWLFFITLSTFIARYYKETLTKLKIMKLDFWYFSHVFTMSMGFLCLVIAIILEIRATSGWKNAYRSNFHTYSGIIAICLYVAEIVMGLWVKRGVKASDRRLLSVLHSIFGHLGYNIALINMAFSGRVAYGFLSCNFNIYVLAWLGIYYLLHCFMSYHYCWVDFILGRTGSAYGPRQVITQKRASMADTIQNIGTRRHSLRKSRQIASLEAMRQEKVEEPAIEAPGKYIRILALVIFSIVTTVYTFWTLRKLLTYPKHCYNFKQLKALEAGPLN